MYCVTWYQCPFSKWIPSLTTKIQSGTLTSNLIVVAIELCFPSPIPLFKMCYNTWNSGSDYKNMHYKSPCQISDRGTYPQSGQTLVTWSHPTYIATNLERIFWKNIQKPFQRIAVIMPWTKFQKKIFGLRAQISMAHIRSMRLCNGIQMPRPKMRLRLMYQIQNVTEFCRCSHDPYLRAYVRFLSLVKVHLSIKKRLWIARFSMQTILNLKTRIQTPFAPTQPRSPRPLASPLAPTKNCSPKLPLIPKPSSKQRALPIKSPLICWNEINWEMMQSHWNLHSNWICESEFWHALSSLYMFHSRFFQSQCQTAHGHATHW